MIHSDNGFIVTDAEFFSTHDKFDKEMILRYIKELTGHFGKIVIIMDIHCNTSRLYKNSCIMTRCKAVWLSAATLKLSATESTTSGKT